MIPAILTGDCRAILPTLPAESVQCVVTSPPYFGLRDYQVDGQIGHEPTPAEYVATLVAVFREIWRVLRRDGTVWLNLGDSYNAPAGSATNPGISQKGRRVPVYEKGQGYKKAKDLKPKDLIGIPWRVAFALQDDGWYLRSDIIWHKPNPMPESVTDRPTKAHEYVFLLAKSERYYYNRPDRNDTEQTGRRNRRTVWTISTQPFSGAHFAVMPEALVEPCILAGSRPGDTILDPFAGSGTVLRVATRLQRQSIGIELNPAYIALAEQRTNGVQLQMIEREEAA